MLIYFFGGKYIGIIEAKYDIWQGHYEIRYGGLQFFEVTQAKILNGYGIAYRRATDCRINRFIVPNIIGYNLTMKKAIKANLGICVDSLLFMRKENECNAKPDGPLVLMETLKPQDNR